MGEMTIGRPNIPNDVLMQRLGITGHMQSPQPQPIQRPQPAAPPVAVKPPEPAPVAPPVVTAPVITPIRSECCLRCKHFHSFVAGGSGMVINGVEKPAEEVTECRRYPPTNGAMGPVFVKVNKDHFCGEFARKDSTQRNRMGAPEDSKGIAAQEALVDTYGLTADEARRALDESVEEIKRGAQERLGKTIVEMAKKQYATQETKDGQDNPDGVQSQSSGVGENLRKKRGRPAKGIQGGSRSNKKKGKAQGGTVVQEHPQGV